MPRRTPGRRRRTGLHRGQTPPDPARPWQGRTGRATPWDPALSAAMTRHAVRIEEERGLGDLLVDLAAGAEPA
ncbi:DUF2399 domain-containing protein [Planomonospora parontospora]|uniref:DUF2399 domain-containing protein n=1 Tax=Planomonospora parontospora TaxID=58119 RepID=UPI0016703A60